jgi:uncharacterized protein YdeI (BOF family)
MSRVRIAGVAAVAAALAITQVAQATAQDDKDVQLTGCVVRDEGGDGFLLTNMPSGVAVARADATAVSPGPVGTSGTSATVFFWLDDDDELEEHVGHKVTVRGELEGDVKDGEIQIERKESWTEMTIDSNGRDLKVRVPQTLFIMPAAGTRDEKLNVLVRKVDAKEVRMIAASCEP